MTMALTDKMNSALIIISDSLTIYQKVHVQAEDVAQQVNCLLQKHENLNSGPQHSQKKNPVYCNSNTGEAETR